MERPLNDRRKCLKRPKPLKVVYISNPVRVTTTAATFRALVQRLTGRGSDVASAAAAISSCLASEKYSAEVGSVPAAIADDSATTNGSATDSADSRSPSCSTTVDACNSLVFDEAFDSQTLLEDFYGLLSTSAAAAALYDYDRVPDVVVEADLDDELCAEVVGQSI